MTSIRPSPCPGAGDVAARRGAGAGPGSGSGRDCRVAGEPCRRGAGAASEPRHGHDERAAMRSFWWCSRSSIRSARWRRSGSMRAARAGAPRCSPGCCATADQRRPRPRRLRRLDHRPSCSSAGTPDQRAELELRLSLGLLEITSDLASGRLEPQQVNPELFVYPQEVDPAAVIRAAAGAQDIAAFVAGYEPSQPEYRRLKAALADYRALAAAGGWPTIDDGPTLKPDMTGPRVAQLRARLGVPPAAGRRSGAVRSRAGRSGQGVPGAARPGAGRADRPEHACGPERAGPGARPPDPAQPRAPPLDGRRSGPALRVRQPRRLRAEGGGRSRRTVFDTRVVVGAPYHRTPVFSGEMTYIEINPYWNVPPSIARNELLPKIKADPGYLAANDFELLSDWSDSARVLDPHSDRLERRDARALHLQAAPGARRRQRARPHQVHVPQSVQHLSARHAGARPVRPGRARLQPRLHPGPGSRGASAAFVLDRQPGWSLDAIKAAIATGKRQIVTLDAPLPVHIAYLTAWVNKDGTVHFRRDVYGRDAILAAALLGPQAWSLCRGLLGSARRALGLHS